MGVESIVMGDASSLLTNQGDVPPPILDLDLTLLHSLPYLRESTSRVGGVHYRSCFICSRNYQNFPPTTPLPPTQVITNLRLVPPQ